MAVAVHLPKVGMTMEEATLTRWLVAEGAAVGRGVALFEMETEKVEMEVEADGEGRLARLVEEGTRLQPGAVVGCLLAEGDDGVPPAILSAVARQWSAPAGSDEPPPVAAEPAADAAAEASVAASAEALHATESPAAPAGDGPAARVVASPYARRLARQAGIDLATLAGSGPGGRVIERDIEAAVARRGRAASRQPAGVEPPAPSVRPEPVEGRAAPAPAAASTPYAGRRRTIGERMHASLQSSAQLTLSSETRVDEAMRMLHGLNREWRGERVAVTFTALVVRACALALGEHPALHARLEGDRIVHEPVAHVGFAVHLDDGLMVPVVRDAATRSLQDVARSVADLNERAKSGALSPDDVTGGTFTVTSLEGTVVDAFTPVLNPPQSAILGVGRVREVPAFEGDAVVRARVTALSLTFDHRVVDGGPSARFLGRVGELLERPYLLM